MSLFTRDLLGNHHSSKQFQIPDLKTEKDYLGRCWSTNTPRNIDETVSKPQNVNQTPLSLLDDTNLDLKLVSLPSSSSPSSSSSSLSSPPYTLGKVKFALERAEKEYTRKRSGSSSESFYEIKFDDEAYAAGCPNCLLYVLISSRNPKCPRCNTIVPSPTTIKKPRIDLNITI